MLAGLTRRDQALTEFEGFENFNVDVTDETRICHGKICSSILSGQFQFCLLAWKGPKQKYLR